MSSDEGVGVGEIVVEIFREENFDAFALSRRAVKVASPYGTPEQSV
jgi:hypothetical protein